MQKTPQARKSHQEFEEEDDVEVDKLTISDVGPDARSGTSPGQPLDLLLCRPNQWHHGSLP